MSQEKLLIAAKRHIVQQRRSISFRMALLWLISLLLIAILSPLIANDKPLMIVIGGQHFFPAFSGEEFISIQEDALGKLYLNVTDRVALSKQKARAVYPLIPWHPHKSDMSNADYVAPCDVQFIIGADGNRELLEDSRRHLLGTGKRGEDVLSGLIHGARISLSVGVFSMIIAGFIGLLMGSLSGYFGDYRLEVPRIRWILILFSLLPAWFYGFQVRSGILKQALSDSVWSFTGSLFLTLVIFIAIMMLFGSAGELFKRSKWLYKKVAVPVDSMISRFMEIFTSMPKMILIISLAAIAKPSILNLILIIGFTSWVNIARLTRAEMLRLREMDFLTAARGLGFRELHIMIRHGIPNAIGPALVAISFGVASAILTESGLSFLGIGVPQDITTWGSMLYAGRQHFDAWWLVVFPGVFIFLTVTSLNLMGDWIHDYRNPASQNHSVNNY